MTWVLLIVVLIAACVIALMLLQRLADAQQKLAALHDDLRRNDLKLQNEVEKLNAKNSDAGNLNDASTHEEKTIEQ